MSLSKSLTTKVDEVATIVRTWRDDNRDAREVAEDIVEWHLSELYKHIRQEDTGVSNSRTP